MFCAKSSCSLAFATMASWFPIFIWSDTKRSVEWRPLGYFPLPNRKERQDFWKQTIGQMPFISPSGFCRPHYYKGPALMALRKLIDHVFSGSPRSEGGGRGFHFSLKLFKRVLQESYCFYMTPQMFTTKHFFPVIEFFTVLKYHWEIWFLSVLWLPGWFLNKPSICSDTNSLLRKEILLFLTSWATWKGSAWHTSGNVSTLSVTPFEECYFIKADVSNLFLTLLHHKLLLRIFYICEKRWLLYLFPPRKNQGFRRGRGISFIKTRGGDDLTGRLTLQCKII